MRFKQILNVCLIIFIANHVHAQTSSDSTASIYFMRISGKFGGSSFSAFVDDKLACHLNNNSFSEHQIKAGRHHFQARFNGKKPKEKQMIEIDVKAGKSYYFLLDVTDHYLYVSLMLEEVTENTFKKLLPKLKQDENCGSKL